MIRVWSITRMSLTRMSLEECHSYVRCYPHHLTYVKDQIDELCHIAVSTCGSALRHVAVQTRDVCLAALKNEGQAIQSTGCGFPSVTSMC